MNEELDFIEKVAEIVSHPEFDMSYVLKALSESCLERMAKESDENSARVWILLTKAQKLLATED
jgi:hypothetical protein